MLDQDPNEVSVHCWEYPCEAWERIHIDYDGPIFGHVCDCGGCLLKIDGGICNEKIYFYSHNQEDETNLCNA